MPLEQETMGELFWSTVISMREVEKNCEFFFLLHSLCEKETFSPCLGVHCSVFETRAEEPQLAGMTSKTATLFHPNRLSSLPHTKQEQPKSFQKQTAKLGVTTHLLRHY